MELECHVSNICYSWRHNDVVKITCIRQHIFSEIFNRRHPELLRPVKAHLHEHVVFVFFVCVRACMCVCARKMRGSKQM